MNERELEQHRFDFEGATSMMARHLVDDHGVPATTVKPWANGLDQGSWVALDDLHKEAHMSNELREAAQRVTGYIRARALMSNNDPEVISDIAIMPGGALAPLEFRLLAADLEALAVHAIGATPTEAVTPAENDENKYGGCPVLNCGYTIGPDDLPPRPVYDFGEAADEVIAMLAETAEELAVAGTIGHHVLDHSMADLMDTITHLGSQLRFQAVALPEEANAEIVDRAELESLRTGAKLLDALYAAGVDNWEGYAEVKVDR